MRRIGLSLFGTLSVFVARGADSATCKQDKQEDNDDCRSDDSLFLHIIRFYVVEISAADSNQEHDSAGFFREHRRIAADDGIHLLTRYRLAVLSFVQSLPVDGLGNLFGGHTAVTFHDDIYDGFFNFHDLSVR